MTGINQFLPFAYSTGANSLLPADYQTAPWRPVGFNSGPASSQQVNTVLRQGSDMCAALGQMVANTGQNALDDGSVTALTSALTSAVQSISFGVNGNIGSYSNNGGHTGNIGRTIAQKATDIYGVNVLDYGADPTGATSSNAAFTAASLICKTLLIPPGTYQLNNLTPINGSVWIGVQGQTVITSSGGDVIVGVTNFTASNINFTTQSSTLSFITTATLILNQGVTKGSVSLTDCTFNGGLHHVYVPLAGVSDVILRRCGFSSSFGLSRAINAGTDFISASGSIIRYEEEDCLTTTCALGLLIDNAQMVIIRGSSFINSVNSYAISLGFNTYFGTGVIEHCYFTGNGTAYLSVFPDLVVNANAVTSTRLNLIGNLFDYTYRPVTVLVQSATTPLDVAEINNWGLGANDYSGQVNWVSVNGKPRTFSGSNSPGFKSAITGYGFCANGVKSFPLTANSSVILMPLPGSQSVYQGCLVLVSAQPSAYELPNYHGGAALILISQAGFVTIANNMSLITFGVDNNNLTASIGASTYPWTLYLQVIST